MAPVIVTKKISLICPNKRRCLDLSFNRSLSLALTGSGEHDQANNAPHHANCDHCMPPKLNRSVAVQVVIALVATVTVALVIVGALAYQAYSRQQRDELELKLNRGADRLATSIAPAAWKLDHDQIHKILESALLDPAVYGVVARTGDRDHAVGRDAHWNLRDARIEEFSGLGLLEASRDINFVNHSIGTLQLYLTPKYVDERLAETKKISVAALVFVDILLILTLYTLLRWCVLRPLQLIEAFAVAVSSGRKGDDVVITPPLAGEFGELRTSIEKMVTLLESRLTDVKESNDRFRQMVSGFPIALAIYAPASGEVTFVNRKFVQVLGYRLEDIPRADGFFVLAYPDASYRQEVITSWLEKIEVAAQQDAAVEPSEYLFTCKDGTAKNIEIGGVWSGDVMLVVFNDVTERKRAEQAVLTYQEDLEKLVQQRTEELVVARDLAEGANRAKSSFLANMSHELRTPLNSVIGFSRLMAKESGLTPQQQRNLEIINRSGAHLLTLINDILELSKIEAGKLEVSRDSVALPQLLNEVADMLQPRAQQQGIALIVETSNLPAAVTVDVIKLRQVLLNLVANAVKFTYSGGVTVVANGRRQGDDVCIDFRVSDTGIGIRAEDQRRVFEPFVQVAGQVGERSGTGLGLAISRQYVQMLGGTLELQSALGEGSTFSFSLTLPIGHIPAASRSEDAGRVVGPTSALRGFRVVIAEDVAAMRLLLRELLEPLGLDVLEAENGVQALELILTAQPHLVLLDWRMPKLDGLEVTRRVRQRGDIVQPKIIMLTANAFTENRQEAVAAGVNDFMAKPINMDVLYGMVERHMGVHFQREEDANKSSMPVLTKWAAADVACLSVETRECITQALRELNPAKISAALAVLRAENRQLADRLATCVDAMQYRELWQIFEIFGT
jgi:PAS domain S-box-containing protein